MLKQPQVRFCPLSGIIPFGFHHGKELLMAKTVLVYADCAASAFLEKAARAGHEKITLVNLHSLSELVAACRKTRADALWIGESGWQRFAAIARHPEFRTQIGFPVFRIPADAAQAGQERMQQPQHIPARRTETAALNAGEALRTFCGHKKCREILRLIAEAGKDGIPPDSIQRTVWPESQSSRRADIQCYVSKIRRELGKRAGQPFRIVFSGSRYYLLAAGTRRPPRTLRKNRRRSSGSTLIYSEPTQCAPEPSCGPEA